MSLMRARVHCKTKICSLVFQTQLQEQHPGSLFAILCILQTQILHDTSRGKQVTFRFLIRSKNFSCRFVSYSDF